MLTNSIDFSASWMSAALAVSEARSPSSLLVAADWTCSICSTCSTLPKLFLLLLIGSIAGRTREDGELELFVMPKFELFSDPETSQIDSVGEERAPSLPDPEESADVLEAEERLRVRFVYEHQVQVLGSSQGPRLVVVVVVAVVVAILSMARVGF